MPTSDVVVSDAEKLEDTPNNKLRKYVEHTQPGIELLRLYQAVKGAEGTSMNTQSAHPNHQPLIVISAVGLCLEHLGEHTPTLSQLAQRGAAPPSAQAIPAVTTTGQATMLTGTTPEEHGIVANGWLFHELGEIWFWRQSEALMQKPPSLGRA